MGCIWAWASEAIHSEFRTRGGRGGPAYSVCWLESLTPALGCVRVWVPVKAKRKALNDPPIRGAVKFFCLGVHLCSQGGIASRTERSCFKQHPVTQLNRDQT